MKITIVMSSTKPKLKAGDRHTTKRHGEQIRVQCMSRSMNGQPMGRMVSNGRPVFDWRKPCELDPWDLHLLPPPMKHNSSS